MSTEFHALIFSTVLLSQTCVHNSLTDGQIQVHKYLMLCLKPVLNWANVCSPEHTLDTAMNYDSFLN